MKSLDREQFELELRERAPEALAAAAVDALFCHYQLLRRWNERMSLVGPGTVDEAVEVHYADSLRALPLLPGTAGAIVVDLGSGAGFPGLVLAAARPDLDVVLVEARERKWSFLKSAVSECGIPARCLLGTVDRALPPGFPERVQCLTLRALRLPRRAWGTLLSRLDRTGRVLVWAGREDPRVPPELRVVRSVPLPGGRWKRIIELERT